MELLHLILKASIEEEVETFYLNPVKKGSLLKL